MIFIFICAGALLVLLINIAITLAIQVIVFISSIYLFLKHCLNHSKTLLFYIYIFFEEINLGWIQTKPTWCSTQFDLKLQICSSPAQIPFW